MSYPYQAFINTKQDAGLESSWLNEEYQKQISTVFAVMLVINKGHKYCGPTQKHFVIHFGFRVMVPGDQLAVFLRIRQAKETVKGSMFNV